LDATHLLTHDKLLPAFGREHLQRQLETQPILSAGKGRIGRFLDRIGLRLRFYLAS